MIQLLQVIPARELALGHRVHTGHGSDSNLTVRGVKRDKAGVEITFGGRGMAVLYPPDEEVAIIECVFEDQLQDGMAPKRN
jgi:hypothetical protein